MNIMYTLQDKKQPKGCTVAIAEIQSMYYDSEINGAVISCADGSRLVKHMSVKFFTTTLQDFVQQSASVGIMYVSIGSVGAFMRVPEDHDYQSYVLDFEADYCDTIPAWDVDISDSERSTPGRRGVSKMCMT